MNGSNHREESDRRPMEFCPECQPKIWWSCGVDPVSRCRALARLSQDAGLLEDARLFEAEALALERSVGRGR